MTHDDALSSFKTRRRCQRRLGDNTRGKDDELRLDNAAIRQVDARDLPATHRDGLDADAPEELDT